MAGSRARVTIHAGILDSIGTTRADEVVNEAMEDGVELAQHLVPVLTGELHDGIEILQFAENGVGKYGVDSVDHSEAVEFGTFKMAAQPYLRPSMDALNRRLR